MNFKRKSWLWYLTFPFAHKNYTVIGDTIYTPDDKPIPQEILDHERIHMDQMEERGMILWYFLYLFCLPILFNPWRKKWEMEAYTKGSGWSEEHARAKLKTSMYGWLI